MKELMDKRKVRSRLRHKENPRREMTFLQHLDELRGRLIICVVSILLTTIVGGGLFARRGVALLTRPFIIGAVAQLKGEEILTFVIGKDRVVRVLNLEALLAGKIKRRDVFKILPAGDDSTTAGLATRVSKATDVKPFLYGMGAQQSVIATVPYAPFLAWIKVALIIGITFALPVWLHQIWLFVAPAMTTAERKVIRPVVAAGVFLFPTGVAFAYAMLYVVMSFLIKYAKHLGGIQLMPDIQRYISFAIMFMLTFGLVFETPLVILMLVRMGVVSTATLRKSRPYAIVIIAVLSAVLTPQDPFSMIAMMIPMLILFEVSLWASLVVERRVRAEERKMGVS